MRNVSVRIVAHQVVVVKAIDVKQLMKCCTVTSIAIRDWTIKILNYIDDTHAHNFIINMYASAQSMEGANKAIAAFNALSIDERDIFSVGALLKCLLRHHRHKEAIALYKECHGIAHNDVSNMLFLKACIGGECYDDGRPVIDACLTDQNIHQQSTELITTAIRFCGHFGRIEDAVRIFHSVAAHQRHISMANALMACYLDHDRSADAMSLFHGCETLQMAHTDISRTLFLTACIQRNDSDSYEAGDTMLRKRSCMLDTSHSSIELINAAIHLYGHFAQIETATHIFDSIPAHKRDIVSVSTLMQCYIQHGRCRAAIALCEACQLEHDDVSMLLFLKACTERNDDFTYFGAGKALIETALRPIYNASHALLVTVIDFYGHFGCVGEARTVFHSIAHHKKRIESIGAMMNAFHVNGQWTECLSLFHSIAAEHRNAHCYCIALNACAASMSVEHGSNLIAELHDRPDNVSVLQTPEVQGAIIRFSGKTRGVQNAIEVFESIDGHILKNDEKGWIYAAILDCYARAGESKRMLSLYQQIRMENQVEISDALYSIVLTGCAHSGMVDEALQIFRVIESETRMNAKFVVAMMDCFGRSEQIEQAYNLYILYQHKLDMKGKLFALTSMLSACHMHNHLAMAQHVYRQAQTMLQSTGTANENNREEIQALHVLMSNMYAHNHNKSAA